MDNISFQCDAHVLKFKRNTFQIHMICARVEIICCLREGHISLDEMPC